MRRSMNCVSIGSDNGLSPERHQAIIWISADTLLIGPQGTYFNEILLEIQIFSFKKIRFNMSAKWRPFCPGEDELITPAAEVFQVQKFIIMSGAMNQLVSQSLLAPS